MKYTFLEYVKITKIYMVNFNVTIFNRLKIMVLFANGRFNNAIFKKTVNQTFHYFEKMSFTKSESCKLPQYFLKKLRESKLFNMHANQSSEYL